MFVDGELAFTVSPETADRLGLEAGGSVDLGEVTEAPAESARGAAREAALRLLAVRARSRRELEDRLARKGHEASVVEDVISALEGVGLIDDVAFARLWVEERIRLRPAGPRKLTAELLKKGIDRGIVERVLGEMLSGASELELARRTLAKRRRTSRGGDPAARRARDYAFMIRRGFSHEVAAAVMKEEDGEDG